MKTNHLLLAMTFMSLFLFGSSLFAQQEVDPTWFDPWAGPTASAPKQLAAQPSTPQAVEIKSVVKTVAASSEGKPVKARAKRLASRETASQADHSRACYPARSISQISALSSGNEASFCHAPGPFSLIAVRQMAGLAPPQL